MSHSKHAAPTTGMEKPLFQASYELNRQVVEDDRMFAIRMSDEGGLMAIAKSGFTHGRAEDFGDSIRRRVAEAHRQLSGQLKHGKRKDPSARGK